MFNASSRSLIYVFLHFVWNTVIIPACCLAAAALVPFDQTITKFLHTTVTIANLALAISVVMRCFCSFPTCEDDSPLSCAKPSLIKSDHSPQPLLKDISCYWENSTNSVDCSSLQLHPGIHSSPSYLPNWSHPAHTCIHSTLCWLPLTAHNSVVHNHVNLTAW